MNSVHDYLNQPKTFVSVHTAAFRLSVPSSWLLREVKAGTLPGMKAGGRWVVPFDAVKAEMLKRAGVESEGGDA